MEAAGPSLEFCNCLGRGYLWRSGSRRCVHLCTRRSRRSHLWPMRGKPDARMTWPMRASFGRAQGGRRAYDVADAGIFLDARKEADARILPRAYDVATRATF